MSYLPYVCLVALMLNAGAQLQGQTLQTQLEVNLGPLAIDSYDGIQQNSYNGVASGPDNTPACNYTYPGAGGNFRGCMQAVLAGYSQQGVVGVKIYFGMNGDAVSTPFLNQSGALNPTWEANFKLFLQDVRAANIRYVSFAPVWVPYATGPMTIYACISGSPGSYSYNFGCNAENANAIFYPWLPWALYYNNPLKGGPYGATQQNDYEYVPELGDPNTPAAWAWTADPSSGSPLYNLLNFIFGAVADAQLQVREFSPYLEIPMRSSSVYGRLSYDSVQLVNPMAVINQIMQSNRLSPTASLTTAAFQPQNDSYCQSQYMDFTNSGLVVDEFLLLSASAGGSFGSVNPDSNNYYCGAMVATDTHSPMPSGGLALVDVHAYPADFVKDNGFGWLPDPNFSGFEYYPGGTQPITNSPSGCSAKGCSQDDSYDIDPGNPSASSETAANLIYSAISGFIAFYTLSDLPAIIGETDAYNPGGWGRDHIYFPPTTEGNVCGTYGPYSYLEDTFPYKDPGSGTTYTLDGWCEPDWKWHRPWSASPTSESLLVNVASSAGENVAGLVTTGLNRSGVVVRPWAIVGWGSILSPAPLSGNANLPYNVGACQPSYSFNQDIGNFPANGGTAIITIGSATGSACAWSIGPDPPAESWPDGILSATMNGQPCTYPPQLGSNCWNVQPGQLPSAAPATASFQIAGNGTGATRQLELLAGGTAFIVTQPSAVQPPATPTGLSPANGTTGVSLSPTLSWSSAANANHYELFFGTQSNPPYITTLPATSTSYSPGQLAAGTTYYWSVTATNSYGRSPSATVWFTTQTTSSSSTARAAFKDTNNTIQMMTYSSSVLSPAGGIFAGNPSIAEDRNGNVFAAAVDDYGSVWANEYNVGTSSWSNWKEGGSELQGDPSVATDASGTAWIAARDEYTSYWLVNYTTGGGFGTWQSLDGLFSSDPVVTACSDGSVYVIGRDDYGALWSGRYIPVSGFQGWAYGGGGVAGKPSATCGRDNAVYIAAEDDYSSNWVARVAGNTWTGWFYGGAITSVPPRIAALGNGSEAIVILDEDGVVWRTTFTEGTGDGWQPWLEVGGILQDVAASAVGSQLFLAGRTSGNELYWWAQSTNQWTGVLNDGSVGALSAAPR